MKIAIHNSKGSFSERWIAYCERSGIPFKVVDCYSTTIMTDLDDCQALMWHFHQASTKDFLFAKQLLYSVSASGKKVFPDFNTMWHFDDKVGQKYLLESIGAPLVPTYVFYDLKQAIEWVNTTTFPKVFKLRGGAGSENVRLVRTRGDALKLCRQAFGKGFKKYDGIASLKERIRKWRIGKATALSIVKGIARLAVPPKYATVSGREVGYIYFQDFIPGNDSDIRIIVIDNKAFAIRRMTRPNDFRASGSGMIRYERENFDVKTVRLSFELADKLKSQCLAIDYVYADGKPLVVEISYGYIKEVYYPCVGYWDRDLSFKEGEFDSQAWMVESLVR